MFRPETPDSIYSKNVCSYLCNVLFICHAYIGKNAAHKILKIKKNCIKLI